MLAPGGGGGAQAVLTIGAEVWTVVLPQGGRRRPAVLTIGAEVPDGSADPRGGRRYWQAARVGGTCP